METLQHDLEYRGYTISPVFHYSDGKSDFNVCRPDVETGYLEYRQTLDDVKAYIDEMIEDSILSKS